jgi:hypothetical protein
MSQLTIIRCGSTGETAIANMPPLPPSPTGCHGSSALAAVARIATQTPARGEIRNLKSQISNKLKILNPKALDRRGRPDAAFVAVSSIGIWPFEFVWDLVLRISDLSWWVS